MAVTARNPLYGGRKRRNVAALGLACGATLFGLTWLVIVLAALLWQGLSGLNLDVFTHMTPPPGATGGGLLNAIVGSLLMTGLGVAIGTPIGVLAGTYMAEYGRYDRLTSVVRFINDILLSAPSIVVGLFVYEVMVYPLGHFSGWAGAVALAIIVIPVVVRTTEDMLLLVPNALREAAAALGLPRAYIVRRIAYRAARAGIITGILLAIARISGETAPLLFTALNNQFWSTNLNAPMAEPSRRHLPVRAVPIRRLAAAGLDWSATHHAGRTCPEHSCPRPVILEKYAMNMLSLPSQAVPTVANAPDQIAELELRFPSATSTSTTAPHAR